MLAPDGEQEGAELFSRREGQGSGVRTWNSAVKNPPA